MECDNWVCTGIPVEAAQPRGARSQHDSETSTPILQVYGMHGHFRHVQAVREPCLFGAQRRGQARHGEEVLVGRPGLRRRLFSARRPQRLTFKALKDQRRDHHYPAAHQERQGWQHEGRQFQRPRKVNSRRHRPWTYLFFDFNCELSVVAESRTMLHVCENEISNYTLIII